MIIKVKSMQQNLQRWRVFGSQSTRRICIISANDGGLPVHKLGEYASDAHVSIIAGFTHVPLKKVFIAPVLLQIPTSQQWESALTFPQQQILERHQL